MNSRGAAISPSSSPTGRTRPGRERQATASPSTGTSISCRATRAGSSRTWRACLRRKPSPAATRRRSPSEISAGRFDAFVVPGWSLRSYWQAVRACRRARVPVMVRGDSQLAGQRGGAVGRVKGVVFPHMLKQFDACLYVGQRNREYLEHYGVSAEATVLLAALRGQRRLRPSERRRAGRGRTGAEREPPTRAVRRAAGRQQAADGRGAGGRAAGFRGSTRRPRRSRVRASSRAGWKRRPGPPVSMRSSWAS